MIRMNNQDLFEDLFYLACKGKEEDVDYLIDEYPKDINRKCEGVSGGTILHAFIEEENIDVVKKLIKAGADVDAKDKRGETPLHTATVKRDIEIVEKLINAGANVNVKDNRDRTPLAQAAEDCSIKIVKKLIEAGAHVNGKIISKVKSDIEEFSQGYEGGRMRRGEQQMVDNYTEILKLLLKGKAKGGGRAVSRKKRKTRKN
jgi:ankyrin repeat protein